LRKALGAIKNGEKIVVPVTNTGMSGFKNDSPITPQELFCAMVKLLEEYCMKVKGNTLNDMKKVSAVYMEMFKLQKTLSPYYEKNIDTSSIKEVKDNNTSVNENPIISEQKIQNKKSEILKKIKNDSINAIKEVQKNYNTSKKYQNLNNIARKQTDDFFADAIKIISSKKYEEIIKPNFKKTLKADFARIAITRRLVHHSNNLGARLVLDIMAAIFTAGIFTLIAGIIRAGLGKSFFFSTVKTDREIKTSHDVISNVKKNLPK
jgi:hypothetical protein